MAALIDTDALIDFRLRGMNPDTPDVRGTAQNPDVFFQAREACNPYHLAVPGIVQETMDSLAQRTGRSYSLVEYRGAPDAERVVVLMGSGVGAAREAVDALVADGERVGMLTVRLYRPFPAEQLVSALPPSVRSIAVLDRTKEPGAVGEPLYLDVRAAIDEAMDSAEPAFSEPPRVIGGRYGLSSKEFTPAMAKAALDELKSERPKHHFTVGIFDDVTSLSIPWDRDFRPRLPDSEVQAVFYGLGSDGTVGANKNSAKIIVDATDDFVQGYFVYDSKKSGAMTASHLRFGPEPIHSTYLITNADFVACHQFNLLERVDILDVARDGATFLLNSPYGPAEVWERLPGKVQRQLQEKHIRLWVIDALRIAAETQMGNRINTVMQPCFFALSGVLPADLAVAEIKASVEKAYGKRGRTIVERNFAAIDAALANLAEVQIPSEPAAGGSIGVPVPDSAPDFVRHVTSMIMDGQGDLLPVSALPADGRFPSGTTRYEKRDIAVEMPMWDPDICIDCGKCAIVCPHATIRMKVYPAEALESAPQGFLSKPFRSKDLAGHFMTIQVAPDDCTGCGVCVDVCPAKSKTEVKHKSINMEPALENRERLRSQWDFFLSIPELDRSALPHDSVKGSQTLLPLFEFSGACAGCGETPYLKLASQLFGDRMLVANATGCSSIYGGNLPTTPWTTNGEGRGPAWSNSLFEDNAEFGLGIRLGLEAQQERASGLLRQLAEQVGPELAASILDADQSNEEAVFAQRARVARLDDELGRLVGSGDAGVALAARHLSALTSALVRKSVWIFGGDGWAYDIGFGGLDHVLSSGRDVNILVLDTEVYSNTGGQASKSTQRGAMAKFAAAGKESAKKDLGAVARSYGNVYVAQISMGANDTQATKAFLEAEAYPGTSLIIAYSTCIAHGIDMSMSMTHQKDAVRSGYWPLYRFHPSPAESAQPFQLDSKAPSIPLAEFTATEARYATLARTHPHQAARLASLAQADVAERWRYYEQLAAVHRSVVIDEVEPEVESDAGYRYDEEV
jgi:pyruvate-ferredoxin/flavodoxin oxidoreductase